MINLMSNPKVSVPITSYNQDKYIEESVMSALSQDYENLQVIVCDDASTDNSKKILLDLKKNYPDRLEVYINNKTLGSEKNRNLSFSYSTGKYITYLDGDDIFLPGKIKKQVEFMDEHPNCALSYHNVEVFDNNSNKMIFYWKDRFGFGDGNVKMLIERGNYLCSLSTMFRNMDIPKEGFLESLSGGADWLFFINLIANNNGEYCYIDEVLARYRRHSSNITLNWNKKILSQYNSIDIIKEKYPQYKKAADRRRSDLKMIDSIIQFNQKNYLKTISLFLESILIIFPKVWMVLRLPFREILFLIRKRGVLDPLLESLFEPDKKY